MLYTLGQAAKAVGKAKGTIKNAIDKGRLSASKDDNGKYSEPFTLKKWVIEPAVLEVNGLSDFMDEIEPVREGGFVRGKLMGFNLYWREKGKDEWIKALDERGRPRVGRRQSLEGSVELIV